MLIVCRIPDFSGRARKIAAKIGNRHGDTCFRGMQIASILYIQIEHTCIFDIFIVVLLFVSINKFICGPCIYIHRYDQSSKKY